MSEQAGKYPEMENTLARYGINPKLARFVADAMRESYDQGMKDGLSGFGEAVDEANRRGVTVYGYQTVKDMLRTAIDIAANKEKSEVL